MTEDVKFGQVRRFMTRDPWDSRTGRKVFILEKVAEEHDLMNPSHVVRWSDGSKEIVEDKMLKRKTEVIAHHDGSVEDEGPRQLKRDDGPEEKLSD